ncbi:MAG: arginine--tRNA ligase [Candidatus Aenigmatarchaeota archaeon]
MLEDEVLKILRSVDIKAKEENLETPPQEELGDLSFPCFQLAKEQKRNPQVIANEIASKIKIPKNSVIEKVEAKGAYVNFFLDYSKFSKIVLKNMIRLNKLKFGRNKKILIEYSSPNPIHPIHVGSARNTFIGESLSRIFQFAGYTVNRLCYINDLGKQIAVLVYGFLKNKIKIKPNKKPDHWLLDIYINANKIVNKNPELNKHVEKILYQYENGDKEISFLVKKIVNLCIKGFKETYNLTNTKFTEYIWESKFVKESKKYVEQLLKKKIAFKTAEGAIVVNLQPYNLPNTVILRSDGTGLYLTRDIPSHIYRIKKYKPSLSITITGEDQKLHFKQLFKIIELLGFKKFSNISHHIPYAYVTLPEGKLSSRRGRVILIDDVFAEAKKAVKQKFKVKDDKLAEKIGVSAVIYALLKIDPDKQVMFNWDEVLSLHGNNGPYLQYTYTRCSSILKKVKKCENVFSFKSLNEEEKKLIKLLSNFPKVVQQAIRDLKPHYVCNYTYDLSTAFNNFYEKHRVINAETNELKNFRLNLVKATKNILGKCLELIGMYAVEKM